MLMSNFVYKCAAGDTFDSVALDVYGNENYAPELLCANPEYSHRTIFGGKETLYLPVIEIPEGTESSIPQTAPWR